MARVLVCIPARQAETAALFSAPVQGFVANAALREALDIDWPGEDASSRAREEAQSEAEYGALVLASVWGLTRFGQRFVLTAEVDAAQLGPGAETGNGGVTVSGLGPEQLVAAFADENPELSGPAAAVAAGLSIDQAWELQEVADLLDHELLWYDLSERGL